MFSTIVKSIGSAIMALGMLLGGSSAVNFGSVNNTAPTGTVPSVFETYLASQQAVGDTTMTIASNALRDGTSLSGYACFTIDSNTSTLEYECGTVSGTSVTGILRGIDSTTGTTSISALIFAHRRGADVKITDYPALTIATNQLNGTQVIPSVMAYDPSVIASSFTSSNQIINKAYADFVGSSGCANSSLTVRGCVQLATQIQSASSTALGSTGAALTINNLFATSSPGSAGLWNVITDNAGKIAATFLNGTGENYTFNATSTFTQGFNDQASTTISASSSNKLTLNGVPYVFPSSQGSSGQFLQNDGSGTLTFAPTTYNVIAQTGSAITLVAATTTIMIPANTFTGNNQVHIQWNCSAGSSSKCDVAIGNGISATTTIRYEVNGGQFDNADITIVTTGVNTEQYWGSYLLNGTLTQLNGSLAWNTASPAYLSFSGNGLLSGNLYGYSVVSITH